MSSFFSCWRKIHIDVTVGSVDSFDSVSRRAEHRIERGVAGLQLKRHHARLPLQILQARSVREVSCLPYGRQRSRCRVSLFLFFLIIQLIGSAPSVSNFASYSGVLNRYRSLRCGITSGSVLEPLALPGITALGVCVAVGLAVGEGVAPGFCSVAGAGGDKNNSTRKNRGGKY